MSRPAASTPRPRGAARPPGAAVAPGTAARAPRWRRLPAGPLALAGIVALGFLLTAFFTRRVTEWLVMTDEMQYVKLALSIWQHGAIVPHIHGAYYGSLSQLYPLLLSPLVGLLDMPHAFLAAHYLNALVMATAAIPAYLLVRGFSRSLPAALAAAALTVAVPYMSMSIELLTEVAAYPAVLWALLGIHRAVIAPSPKRDVLALLGIALAVSARTQFVLLGFAFPAVVVLHELGYALAAVGDRRAALREAARRGARGHLVLWAVVAVGALAAAALAATGRLSSVLGQYSGTTSGPLLPPGIVDSSLAHVDLVIVAVGVIPAVLALGWAVSSLVRPSTRPLHAYAVLGLVVGVALLLEVASFDLRFVNDFLQTRYLGALAPIFGVGMIACLVDPRRRWAGVIVAAIALGRALPMLPYSPAPSPYFSAPDTAFHAVLYGRTLHLAGHLGLHGFDVDTLLRWGTPLAGLVLAALLVRAPRRPLLIGVCGVVLVYGTLETAYVLNKISHGPNGARPVSGGTVTGRDWIDSHVPSGASVALIPTQIADAPVPPDQAGYYDQQLWWDTEFWNKDVEQAYALPGIDTYTVWPKPQLRVDERTGRLLVGDQLRYVALSASAMRFGLRARRVLAVQPGTGTPVLELLDVPRPYRVDWSTAGVGDDGQTNPRWRIRAYGGAAPGGRSVGFDVAARPAQAGRVRLLLRAGRRRRAVTIPSGGTAQPRMTLCVPAGAHADLDVAVAGHAPAVPVKLTRIVAGDAPAGCRGRA